MPAEERKNRCTLKLPIGGEDDDMMDFLDIDEEELVHDVKQAVSPTSSRSLENPDFSGMNLLLSSTSTASGGIMMGGSTSSGQFIPYFGQPLLFPNNNQNPFNLVALCISTPPPFNGLPQNNPFFSSNGISEQVNFVPFSTAPLFYFGLPEENLVTGPGPSNNLKCQNQLGKGAFCGSSNLNFPSNGQIHDLENGVYGGGNGAFVENEVQYNSAKLMSNVVQNQNPMLPNCSGIFGEGVYGNNGSSDNLGLGKSAKLNQNNQLGLLNNLSLNGNSNLGLGLGVGLGCDMMPLEEYGNKLGAKDGRRLSAHGQGNNHQLYFDLNKKQYNQGTGTNSKRMNMSANNCTSECGEQPVNPSSVNSGDSNEKKNRWQLSDPQFKSGYKGVSWNSRMEAWLAFFVENGVRKSKTFSSRKFGFNRAREKAIKYLDARRKGIILTTPPPLSPSKGIYDRIPQQRKVEPGQDNKYSPLLRDFQAFNSEADKNSNNSSSNNNNNLAVTCNSSNDSVASSDTTAITSNSTTGSILETNQTVLCS